MPTAALARAALLAAGVAASAAALAQPAPGAQPFMKGPPPGAPSAQPMQGPGEESDRDTLGLWQGSPNFAAAQKLGARVVDMPAFRSMFAYWLPPGFESRQPQRAIVAVHGTGGTVYAEIQDEAAMAAKLGYAVIAVQARRPGDAANAGGGNNIPPRELYGLIHQSVQALQSRKGLDLSRLAYVGFSAGGASAAQVGYFDRRSPKPMFRLMVNHSGLSKSELGFMREVSSGRAPAQPFAGLAFALWCGMRDEQWGRQQCDDMKAMEAMLAKLGAGPIRAVRDEAGTHMGYRRTPSHHEAFMRWFIELTP